jgi:ribosomal 50S subunit-recycling heat shock protein
MEYARLDKWLWAVRVYKTRSDAAEACRCSAVRLNETIAKPSAKVRIGNTVVARTRALTRTLHVTGLTEKRVGAALVPNTKKPAKSRLMRGSSAIKEAGVLPRRIVATLRN